MTSSTPDFLFRSPGWPGCARAAQESKRVRIHPHFVIYEICVLFDCLVHELLNLLPVVLVDGLRPNVLASMLLFCGLHDLILVHELGLGLLNILLATADRAL